jgi:Xaa-Pro aminopeptidase
METQVRLRISEEELAQRRQRVLDRLESEDVAAVALLRESSRWADNSHRYLQAACGEGRLETEVAIEASLRGSLDMLRALGAGYDPKASTPLPTSCGFRSQIGPNSAFPHAVIRHLTMHRGDNLVTGASAYVWGYKCELERTMFLGEPSADQRRFFELMQGAQETAFEAMRPDRTCADVDRAVRRFYADHGIEEYWHHHVGHGLGMEVHESPFLDVGDDRELLPDMVFSVEPGIFVQGLGGFRHSDTVAITEDGVELMTQYPRDLEALTIPTG